MRSWYSFSFSKHLGATAQASILLNSPGTGTRSALLSNLHVKVGGFEKTIKSQNAFAGLHRTEPEGLTVETKHTVVDEFV